MNKPADSMVAVWTLVVGIVAAVAAIVAGVIYGLQLQAMAQSNILLQKSFEATQRPLVSIGRKDGVVAEFAVPAADMPNQNVGIKIYVQNGGQSPALTPALGLLGRVIVLTPGEMGQSSPPKYPLNENKFGDLVRSGDDKGSLESNASVGSIAPQSEYVYYFPDEVSREQYDSIVKRQRVAMAFARCEYCDVMGQFTCRQFQLFYYGAPFNAFAEIGETDCAGFYTYPSVVSPGKKFLLPCEQPDEREARLKREREQMAIKPQSAHPSKP